MKQIQDWLGHSTFATTADIYSHLDFNSKQVSADAIAAAFMPEEMEAAEEEQAVEDTAYFQMRQRIGELLSQLEEQDARILTLRFGLENGRPMSAQDAAKALGMTTGELSRREAAALNQLRTEK